MADNGLPYIAATPSHIINKIHDIPTAVRIRAEFNHNIIAVTIDTGANIC